MSIKVDVLRDDHIIILHGEEPLAIPQDPIKVMEEVSKFKKEVGGHVYRILDYSKIKITFSDMMVSMAAELDHEGGANDPDVTSLFVGTDEMVRLGTASLKNQEQYGKAKVHLFTSVDEAIEQARQLRRKG